jgi:apolipoprotein N-acyltransferase
MRFPRMRRPAAPLLALACGAATVFGYAPFGFALLPIASLAVLFSLWYAAPGARRAAAIGFAFGVGMFGAGVSWVYIALQTFGGMPAALGVVATAGFVAYLALWPAIAGLVTCWLAARSTWRFAVLAATVWTATEWLRGYVFTGFPWLAVGYAQLPGSPLAGFAPLGGAFLVSLATSLCAALVLVVVEALAEDAPRRVIVAVSGIAVLFVAGALLRGVEWTRSHATPLTVSLVQGNVAQDVKFAREFRRSTFGLYTELVERSRGRLVVLPESAFPMFADEIPEEVVQRLAAAARARQGDVLIGMFTAEEPLPGSDEPRYYNSVVAVGVDPVQLYRKRHLVPFGETIPAKPVVGWFIRNVLAIPLADQTPGSSDQPVVAVAGHNVAVNICYEDVFGAELIDAARAADILVNVTNDAWYGHSIAAWQHNQIAAMRALELGRPMLRATNTGITSAIDVDGRVVAQLPWYTRDILELQVTGRTGLTPYVRFGDVPVLALIAAVLLYAGVRRTIAHRR